MSASATTAPATASTSRSRPQARRKPNDDAPYFAPNPGGGSTAGTKRPAGEKADGEPRVKRKRVETSGLGVAAGSGRRDLGDGDTKTSLVDFTKMPISVIYRYLTHFDLIPSIHPSPLSAQEPPPPASLDRPLRHASRAPSPLPQITPANRPRREPRDQARRRSLRLVEEDIQPRTPVLADIDELQTVLAGMAERHFREQALISGREEVDTLASFMCAVEKAKGGRGK